LFIVAPVIVELFTTLGFHPARTQDGVLFFLPENVVENAPDDGPKLLPFPILCLLIHCNDLSFLMSNNLLG
jgi:hypothetical protein